MNPYQIALLSWLGLALVLAFGKAMVDIDQYPKPVPRQKPGAVAIGLAFRILLLSGLALLVVLA